MMVEGKWACLGFIIRVSAALMSPLLLFVSIGQAQILLLAHICQWIVGHCPAATWNLNLRLLLQQEQQLSNLNTEAVTVTAGPCPEAAHLSQAGQWLRLCILGLGPAGPIQIEVMIRQKLPQSLSRLSCRNPALPADTVQVQINHRSPSTANWAAELQGLIPTASHCALMTPPSLTCTLFVFIPFYLALYYGEYYWISQNKVQVRLGCVCHSG